MNEQGHSSSARWVICFFVMWIGSPYAQAAQQASPSTGSNIVPSCATLATAIPSPVQESLMQKIFEFAYNHQDKLEEPYLELQCDRYVSSAVRARSCHDAASQLTTLDQSLGDASDKLLQDPAFTAYLQDLKNYIDQIQKNGGQGDLWSFTLQHAQGDQSTAIKWLGLLTSQTPPTSYIQSKAQKKTPSADATLFVELSFALQNQTSPIKGLKLYPDFVQSSDPRAYHFYTIAYFASQLGAGDQDKDNMSAFVPFMVNSIYEFKKIDVQTNDLLKFAFPEPDSIDMKTESETVQAAYLSYCGSLWATGRASKAMDYTTFAQQFSSDPKQFLIGFLKD